MEKSALPFNEYNYGEYLIMYKAWLSTKPSMKNGHAIRTDFCANAMKAVISEAGDELILPTAPRN